MSPKIQTPVKGFTGTVAGVTFADGAGETEDSAALAYFARQGYEIIAEEKPKEPTEREVLITEAKGLGLDTKGKNAEIEKRIADHKAKQTAPQTPPTGDENKTPGSDGDGKTPGDADGDEGKEQK